METHNDDENSTVSIISVLVRISIGNDIIPQIWILLTGWT